jgi:hypothetical protein
VWWWWKKESALIVGFDILCKLPWAIGCLKKYVVIFAIHWLLGAIWLWCRKYRIGPKLGKHTYPLKYWLLCCQFELEQSQGEAVHSLMADPVSSPTPCHWILPLPAVWCKHKNSGVVEVEVELYIVDYRFGCDFQLQLADPELWTRNSTTHWPRLLVVALTICTTLCRDNYESNWQIINMNLLFYIASLSWVVKV